MELCSISSFLQLKARCILRHSVVTAMLNKMLSHHEGLSYHLLLKPNDLKHWNLQFGGGFFVCFTFNGSAGRKEHILSFSMRGNIDLLSSTAIIRGCSESALLWASRGSIKTKWRGGVFAGFREVLLLPIMIHRHDCNAFMSLLTAEKATMNPLLKFLI